MRRKPLVATVLVSTLVGAVLAILAPAAAADSDFSSPGNRGWVANHGDAGSNDAGTNEAGTNEAGTNEAGTNEAGTHEAGTNDAGASDVDGGG